MRHTVSMMSATGKHAAINAQENLRALERINARKLGMIVNGSIKAVSVMNKIPKGDVIGVLGKIHVATIGDVQKAVESLEGMEGVDVIRLTVGIEETIKAISGITNLDAGEITGTFAERSGAPVEDVVDRLHARSKAACARHA